MGKKIGIKFGIIFETCKKRVPVVYFLGGAGSRGGAPGTFRICRIRLN